MRTLEDYAPYFEQKEEWKLRMKEMKFEVSAWLLGLTIILCMAQLFIK